jgi:CheY-like chemotaxis protein
LAAQAGIAIENARLYAEVRSYSQDLERKVAERTAEMERANRAKSEFLANMSHELRTPLNSIIGFGDLLKLQHAGPLNPKQMRYLQNIQAGGVHLLNLVNDILDLARIEAGRLVLNRARVTVAPLVAQALEAVRPEAEKKELLLAAELEPELPAIAADPLRLRQILANLLSNAVKFTGSGCRVTVRARRIPLDLLEIQVEDTGIGIAPEDLHRLFQKFEQLETGASKSYQGTGLGLALTRRLTEMHGGSIAVHSAGRGCGSTFTVRLPIDPRRQRPAVLLVDDDPEVRRMLDDACRTWGWEPIAAETLAQARAVVESGLPDLVILDAALPDGSGTAFTREFRRGHPTPVPILMHTGLGAEEGQAALEAGADDYLVKPAPLELIQQKASRLLSLAGWPEGRAGAPAGAGNGGRVEAKPLEAIGTQTGQERSK